MARSFLSRLAAAGLLLAASAARAQGVLTVAMTAGDIPVTGGNPDQGFEGFRFVGVNLYDALINWDLSHADRADHPDDAAILILHPSSLDNRRSGSPVGDRH